MFALTLGQAKTIALLVAAALAIGAIASAWLMQTVMQKVALVLILGLLAVLVWSQRASLDDCADNIADNMRVAGPGGDTTCSFFTRDIQITTSRA
jgi:hypothetical protein